MTTNEKGRRRTSLEWPEISSDEYAYYVMCSDLPFIHKFDMPRPSLCSIGPKD